MTTRRFYTLVILGVFLGVAILSGSLMVRDGMKSVGEGLKVLASSTNGLVNVQDSTVVNVIESNTDAPLMVVTNWP